MLGQLRRPANLDVRVDATKVQAVRLARRELTRFYARYARDYPDVRFFLEVPSEFDPAVRRIVETRTKRESRFFSAGRHGTVGAITIPLPRDHGLDFAVLFSPRAFPEDAFLYAVRRRRVYAHEAGHVLDFLGAFPVLGPQVLFGPPQSVRELLLSGAFGVAGEYRAEAWAIQDELENHHGRFVRPGRYVPSFEGEINALGSAVEEIPAWLQYIHGFLQKREASEMFQRSVIPRLDEITTYTAYTCARLDSLAVNASGLERLRSNPQYRFYFRLFDDLRPGLAALPTFGSAYDVAALDPIIAALRTFYHACGLDFEDAEGRIYLRTHAPPLGADVPLPPDEALRNRISELTRVGLDAKYSHRIHEKARERLRSIAADETFPAWARDEARKAADDIH